VASDFAFSLLGWLFVGGCSSVLSNNFRIGHPTPYSDWVAVWILYGSLVTLHAQSEGLYAGDLRASQPIGRLLLAKSIVAATVITGIAAILARKALPSPGWIVAGAISNFVALLLLRRWQEVARDRKPTINVLIVGAGPVARAVARYFRQNPQLGRVVRGFLDDATAPAFGVLGPTSSLAHIARAEFADEVIIATGTDVSETQLIAQEARAQHLDVRVVSTLPIDVGDHPWIENWAGFPVITLHREDVPFAGLALKRAIDVLVSSGLLILLSPLLLALAILIRIDSDGPSLYSAERVGRKGRKFICYKFRTMVRNANGAREDLRAQNEREGPCFKLDNDPRVTRIGRFLRRYSLDELPQLWNVIRGEMTLVGPRPHPVDDCSRYDLPHLRRLDATPGMTGLWQVSARQASSFETNLRLDLEYIEHWNLWLDFKILAKTLSVVVRGTGT
jgi:exopolysaccharide biosynthesis polyprenyl glycosylphosphotransferase